MVVPLAVCVVGSVMLEMPVSKVFAVLMTLGPSDEDKLTLAKAEEILSLKSVAALLIVFDAFLGVAGPVVEDRKGFTMLATFPAPEAKEDEKVSSFPCPVVEAVAGFVVVSLEMEVEGNATGVC